MGISSKEYREIAMRAGKGARRSLVEEEEQKALVRLLALAGICHVHVPNENPSRGLAGRAKGRGAQSGFPDLLILDGPPDTNAVGVAIEMKRPDGKPSEVRPEQRAWLEKLEERGWVTAVAFGCVDAVEILVSLGYRIGGR